MNNTRRYDIDWLRVIAIALLIVYHIAIGFQPWGALMGFIKNDDSLEWIWYPMAMLNMWRIPILFFVSGMGVYFSMRKRSFMALLLERSQRIVIPLIFGAITIVPLHIFLWQKYYFQDLNYQPGQGHLWFLLNIFVYTLISVPVILLIRKYVSESKRKQLVSRISNPLVFVVAAGLIVAESELLKPQMYNLFAQTPHGYLLGFIAFVSGFIMVSLGKNYWDSFKGWKWLYVGVASLLYAARIVFFEMNSPYYLMGLETAAWIFTVFGFCYQYLNQPSALLDYLRKAAYPVYILHMVVQYGLSYFIFPTSLPVQIKLVLMIVFTIGVSVGLYEFVIKRLSILNYLMGGSFQRK